LEHYAYQDSRCVCACRRLITGQATLESYTSESLVRDLLPIVVTPGTATGKLALTSAFASRSLRLG
jgi:hypothetical protein